MRRRWREVTVDPAYPVGLARRRLAEMAPTGRHLWPDLPYPSLSATPGAAARDGAGVRGERRRAAARRGRDRHRPLL
ncbi:hypothetical protein ACFSTC_58970 [Nonomuraea ferruginea]